MGLLFEHFGPVQTPSVDSRLRLFRLGQPQPKELTGRIHTPHPQEQAPQRGLKVRGVRGLILSTGAANEPQNGPRKPPLPGRAIVWVWGTIPPCEWRHDASQPQRLQQLGIAEARYAALILQHLRKEILQNVFSCLATRQRGARPRLCSDEQGVLCSE